MTGIELDQTPREIARGDRNLDVRAGWQIPSNRGPSFEHASHGLDDIEQPGKPAVKIQSVDVAQRTS